MMSYKFDFSLLFLCIINILTNLESAVALAFNEVNSTALIQTQNKMDHSPVNCEKEMNPLKVRMDRMEKEVSKLKNQNKNLFGKVKLLEEKFINEEKSTKNFHSHHINKRQSRKNSTTIATRYCASAENLCTFFYPDHPDQQIGKNTNSGPSKVIISSRKSNETITQDFNNKMPENCQDLKFLGHTLNGFYLVQKGEGITNEIETIFCQFNQQQSSDNETIKPHERNVGFIQFKTTDVYFNAYNLKRFSGTHATLAFEEEILNVGNAFNRRKGIFTAPVNGIYIFVFSSLRGMENWETNILLRVNRIEVASSYTPVNHTSHAIMTIESTLKLTTGDQVDLFFNHGTILFWRARFMGWLQQEEKFILGKN